MILPITAVNPLQTDCSEKLRQFSRLCQPESVAIPLSLPHIPRLHFLTVLSTFVFKNLFIALTFKKLATFL